MRLWNANIELVWVSWRKAGVAFVDVQQLWACPIKHLVILHI